MSAQISQVWLRELSLDQRRPPDFITSSDDVSPGPYADSIRTCLTDIGLSAVFCIDHAPSVAFLVLDEGVNHTVPVNSAHKALWNQGLASLLAVIQGETIRLYSLNSRPKIQSDADKPQEDERLLDVLNLADQTLKVQGLISGIESGRLTQVYPDAFTDKGRVDAVLLTNLHAARKRMVKDAIDPEQAAKLLMQAMFLAYLRDRDIVNEQYFLETSGDYSLTNLESFFATNHIGAYRQLLKNLNKDFNGGMFSSIEDGTWAAAKSAISDFLRGDIDMETGQYYLFSYDFKYIPVELISEVYDVFLGTDPEEKKASGSFYTPRFLAKLAVDQVWEHIEPGVNLDELPDVIDPACGSGIFLVALFHRYAELYRFHSQQEDLDWDKLVRIAKTLHGMDRNRTAVLIASFSLSIALLEQVSPPQIVRLREQGKKLPRLLGATIKKGDFFDLPVENKYSAIIGNPPWGKARGAQNSGEAWWSDEFKFSCPNREMAWPFVRKSMKHLTTGGVVSFLLPMTSMFFNTRSKMAVALWAREASIHKILNLADMRFLLFRDADHSSVIAVYSATKPSDGHTIAIWSPKADINLASSQRILLSSGDKKQIPSKELASAPVSTIQMAMWAGNRAKKLFSYFSTLPKLSEIITPYKQAGAKERKDNWIYGQGFQPLSKGVGAKYKPTELKGFDSFPMIEASEIDHLAISKRRPGGLRPPRKVQFLNFKDGFSGPRILINHGLTSRFRAVYTEQNLVCNNNVKILSVPYSQEDDGKVLTAILCSSLSSWLLLQSSQVWIGRPRYSTSDLLGLPFPKPEDLPEPLKATEARAKLIRFIDTLVDKEESHDSVYEVMKPIPVKVDINELLSRLDELVFDYFGLLQNERRIISEAMDSTIKSIQPSRKRLVEDLAFSSSVDWVRYCSCLQRELRIWMNSDQARASAGIAGWSKDFVVIRVSLRSDIPNIAKSPSGLQQTLESIYQHLPVGQTRNVHLLRNLMVFIDDDLYILKPRQHRFWLSEIAMDDADTIASELMPFQGNNKDIQ